MSEIRIITDHKWRHFKYGNEVPKKVLRDYNWLGEDEAHDGWIYYRKRWYHISDFMRVSKDMPSFGGWNGYLNDSFFSGIVINMSEDGEEFQIGTWIA